MKNILLSLFCAITFSVSAQHQKMLFIETKDTTLLRKALHLMHIDSFSIFSEKEKPVGYANIKNGKYIDYGILFIGNWLDVRDHVVKKIVVLYRAGLPPNFGFSLTKMSGFHAYDFKNPQYGFTAQFQDYFNHPRILWVHLPH
jgi:hypothetical protein